MDPSRFIILKAEIERNLQDLFSLQEECQNYLGRSKNEGDLFESADIRVIGSILHDFYTCLERIFRKISLEIDQRPLAGEMWHSDLLLQMNLDIPSIRPRVISDELREKLYEYLRFRHVFRNVYGFSLKWQKMKHLATNLVIVYKEISKNMRQFFLFLDEIIK